MSLKHAPAAVSVGFRNFHRDVPDAINEFPIEGFQYHIVVNVTAIFLMKNGRRMCGIPEGKAQIGNADGNPFFLADP